MIKVRNFLVAIRVLRCGIQEDFSAALPLFFYASSKRIKFSPK